ncbi:hypothetical protein [Poritiphilus flavus]|uniref:MetA-pathway of phenol degradation n=1 Tax=Poritiphilus flavus TaxID=2697053 RepID=A0A6L9EBZ3_9FLAO|nr:hypothetical protein [Poritiphilus flavus]NAS12235.1 hypothetical protein [Poritiphilus flavus]
MKKHSFIILAFIITNQLFSQVLSPINPVIGGPTGQGLVDDSCKICFEWLPAKNATEASTIWSDGKRFSFLNTASLNATGETGSAFVDIISDYAGPVRVALTSTVAATDREEESESDQSIERFLSGGGAAVFNFTLIGPTLSWDSNRSYLTFLFNPKLGFDFPALGASTDDSTINMDFGGEVRFNMPLAENNLGFVGHFRGAYVVGGDTFYEGLGLLGDDASSFTYSQVSLGFTLPGINWAILWNKTISGPSSLNDFHKSGRISLIITPK